jgi:phosphoglycerate kinase
MKLRTLNDMDLKGKSVLLRLDLNVPLQDGKITDDTRIKASLPTIRAILEQTNKLVIMSHLGRPKGKADSAFSLEPVGVRLAELLDKDVVFVEDYISEPLSQVVGQLDRNQFVLLENLRFHAGETSNDANFARTLADGFDAYVNDAFGTLHRAHASVVGVPELMKEDSRAAGLLVEKEINELSYLQKNPKAPFSAILGGSKVSDKIGVILNLLNHCNTIMIGGAMAYTFLKYKGHEVGLSRVEEDKMDLVETIYRNAASRKVDIVLPEDHIAAGSFSENAEPVELTDANIPPTLMGLDIGPRTVSRFRSIIDQSETVLWNGPMGVFEWDAFAKGSLDIANCLAENRGYTLVGGGDSVAAINKAGVADKISHVSTGGGASLEFLEGKTLPGVRMLTFS